MKKRKKKSGVFYILKAVYDDTIIYKYGASINLNNRIKAIKYDYKLDFKIFFKKEFDDIFLAEKLFKWECWNMNDNPFIPIHGTNINGVDRYELFVLEDGFLESEIKKVVKKMEVKYFG